MCYVHFRYSNISCQFPSLQHQPVYAAFLPLVSAMADFWMCRVHALLSWSLWGQPIPQPFNRILEEIGYWIETTFAC